MGLAEALGAGGGGVGCGRRSGKLDRPDAGGVRDRFSGFPLRALVVARLQCGGCGNQRRCRLSGVDVVDREEPGTEIRAGLNGKVGSRGLAVCLLDAPDVGHGTGSEKSESGHNDKPESVAEICLGGIEDVACQREGDGRSVVLE